jgi:hypothetical protein
VTATIAFLHIHRPSRQILELYLKLGYDSIFPYLLQFIIYSHPIIQSYIVLNTGSVVIYTKNLNTVAHSNVRAEREGFRARPRLFSSRETWRFLFLPTRPERPCDPTTFPYKGEKTATI